jgi:hypothetical protein
MHSGIAAAYNISLTWTSASSEPVVEPQRTVSFHARSVKRNHHVNWEQKYYINYSTKETDIHVEECEQWAGGRAGEDS